MKDIQILSRNHQATLGEILAYFKGQGYIVYCLDIKTPYEFIVVVDINNEVFATFEPIENTSLYQVYDLDYDVKFSEVAYLWGDTITKLQEVR